MFTITDKQQLSPVVFQMTIRAPHICHNAKPGQFVIVMIEEDGERIPLTIADTNCTDETICLIFQAVGYSTNLMATMAAGEQLAGVLGPLGEAAPIEGYKHVLVIGGGVGIAPLYPQVKALYDSGARVEAILGGRDSQAIILKDGFVQHTHMIHFATDDGSLGRKGFVTEVLKERLEAGQPYDLVIAIGPMGMMRAVCQVTRPYNLKTNVSLNPIMIDGTGMCGGCRVTVGGQTKFACVHGPDFDGHLVDFESAMLRQNRYVDQEQHICNMTSQEPAAKTNVVGGVA